MIVKYKDPYSPKKPIVVELPDDTPQDMVDEVLTYLDEDYRRCRAEEERERYHREFSLDALDYEYSSVAYHDTPERIVIREEELLEYERMLDTLTETQRRRFAMYEEGMTLREIAKIEEADLSSVAESVRAARKKLKNIFCNTPTKRP